jgi:DNA modification methylase
VAPAQGRGAGSVSVPRNQILLGDVREVLATLPDESVHMVCTSPPYWGLRSYGTETWEGGDGNCDHLQPVSFAKSTLGASTGGRSTETHERSISAQATPYRDACGKCGAVRIDRQLGLEATPEEYVTNMVAVFREVKRVLRRDGCLFLNLGDSYASQGGPGAGGNAERMGRAYQQRNIRPNGNYDGLKPKDLVGIPWAVAFALRADGWWLRSDIIWSKAHFATFPTDLVKPCILAGSSEYGVCSVCGAPWRRVTESHLVKSPVHGEGSVVGRHYETGSNGFDGAGMPRLNKETKTLGWRPSCPHEAPTERALILDPFVGSGTSALVALKAGRDFIGIELNPEYIRMAEKRIQPHRQRLL